MEFRGISERWKQRRNEVFVRAQIDSEALDIDARKIVDGRRDACVGGAQAGGEALDRQEHKRRYSQVAAEHGEARNDHALAQHKLARQARRRARTLRRRQHHRRRELS
jgi:hypothetical protein